MPIETVNYIEEFERRSIQFYNLLPPFIIIVLSSVLQLTLIPANFIITHESCYNFQTKRSKIYKCNESTKVLFPKCFQRLLTISQKTLREQLHHVAQHYTEGCNSGCSCPWNSFMIALNKSILYPLDRGCLMKATSSFGQVHYLNFGVHDSVILHDVSWFRGFDCGFVYTKLSVWVTVIRW